MASCSFYLSEKDNFADTPEQGIGIFSWALIQGVNKAKTATKT